MIDALAPPAAVLPAGGSPASVSPAPGVGSTISVLPATALSFDAALAAALSAAAIPTDAAIPLPDVPSPGPGRTVAPTGIPPIALETSPPDETETPASPKDDSRPAEPPEAKAQVATALPELRVPPIALETSPPDETQTPASPIDDKPPAKPLETKIQVATALPELRVLPFALEAQPSDATEALASPTDDKPPAKSLETKVQVATALPELRVLPSVRSLEPEQPPAERAHGREASDAPRIERPLLPLPPTPSTAPLLTAQVAPQHAMGPQHAMALSLHASRLEFADALAQLGSRGEAPTRIEVAGDALGAVSIEVVRQPQGLSVAFDTPSEAARAALDAAQPRLIADARAAGLSFTQSSVGGDRRERRRAPPAWPIDGRTAAPSLTSATTSPNRYA